MTRHGKPCSPMGSIGFTRNGTRLVCSGSKTGRPPLVWRYTNYNKFYGSYVRQNNEMAKPYEMKVARRSKSHHMVPCDTSLRATSRGPYFTPLQCSRNENGNGKMAWRYLNYKPYYGRFIIIYPMN